MTPWRKRKNLYIKRMAEDMLIRNLAENTINTYTWHVDKFCSHFGKMPEQLGEDEIRQYQLFLVNEKKSSWSSFNQAVCALRFLYEVTLKKPLAIKHIPFGKRPKKLPVVLSDQEASSLIQCTENLKHRTVLLTLYAAGLRLAEATHLKVIDIDGQREQIRVMLGKGSKERRVPVSPRLLKVLREYWKVYRPNNFLFPGKTPDVPLSSATIQKACKLSVAKARIKKLATPHTLRHSYATGMLEAGVDLLTISKLLGHSSFITTMIYLHVRKQHFDRSPSPIDWLPVRQCPQWAIPGTEPECEKTAQQNQAQQQSDQSVTQLNSQQPDKPQPDKPQRRRSNRQQSNRRKPRRRK